jgi:hypothetical protein
MLLFLPQQAEEGENYTLSSPLVRCFKTGDFGGLRSICYSKINVNLKAPFMIKGYYRIDDFIEEINERFKQYSLRRFEWIEKQNDLQITTQSMNLELKTKKSRNIFDYRIVFMLEKKEKEWKIFYLRSLKD